MLLNAQLIIKSSFLKYIYTQNEIKKSYIYIYVYTHIKLIKKMKSLKEKVSQSTYSVIWNFLKREMEWFKPDKE